MVKKIPLHRVQPYARVHGDYLSSHELYPRPLEMDLEELELAISRAFVRSKLDKRGGERKSLETPVHLVDKCIDHLRKRSDPILSPAFVSQCEIEDLFELDAVSHEMQRHRMSMGIFYQYLLLELIHKRFPHSFDGSAEDDITVDIDTPACGGHTQGIRLYISVKKSNDTVGGQDIGGMITRLETRAKNEKNLTRPYLCVVGVATPSQGKILSYEKDRKIKCRKDKSPYSVNCETWGPGFIYPYLTGRSANSVYSLALKYVAKYFPFMTLTHKKECSELLKIRLEKLCLLNEEGKVDSGKFLAFCCSEIEK